MSGLNLSDTLDYIVLLVTAFIFLSNKIKTGTVGTLGLGIIMISAWADLDPLVDDSRLKIFLLVGIILTLLEWLMQALVFYVERRRRPESRQVAGAHLHRRASDPP